VIICGHSDCGAIKGVLQPETTKGFANVQAWLRHAVVPKHLMDDANLSAGDRLAALTEGNVIGQLGHLKTHPAVAVRLAQGNLGLHGWVYVIETGEIRSYDAHKGSFVPLDTSLARVTKEGVESNPAAKVRGVHATRDTLSEKRPRAMEAGPMEVDGPQPPAKRGGLPGA
jgi:hypothetical protein